MLHRKVYTALPFAIFTSSGTSIQALIPRIDYRLGCYTATLRQVEYRTRSALSGTSFIWVTLYIRRIEIPSLLYQIASHPWTSYKSAHHHLSDSTNYFAPEN